MKAVKSFVVIVMATFFTYQIAFASNYHAPTYKVEITNLTKGQPMTPPVLAIHKKKFKLFVLGEEASPGLSALAKDGATTTLENELNSASKVVAVAVGDGLILPGETAQIEIKGHGKLRLSLASMFARTNDAFVAARDIPLRMKRGHKRTILLNVYDAGAEINNEQCGFIPAPPCNNPFIDTFENEGYVHPHPGIYGIGDLLILNDVFAGIGAKVVITRVK